MVWYFVPGIALTLLACAIAAEFATRNDSKRPLSKHSLNRRRWDDPNNKDKSKAAVPGSIVTSGMTLGHERVYRVSKDPAAQSKILAGNK